jgi:hypothetical protein
MCSPTKSGKDLENERLPQRCFQSQASRHTVETCDVHQWSQKGNAKAHRPLHALFSIFQLLVAWATKAKLLSRDKLALAYIHLMGQSSYETALAFNG